MSSSPLVSILMTSYNREAFIAEAICSVIDSSFTDFELIIVDDASHDNTVSIARHYAEKDQRIKVYVNEINLGQFNNRNRAASLANGIYLMNVDSDDTIYPDIIKKTVGYMQTFEEDNFGMSYYGHSTDHPYFIDGKKAIHDNFFKKHFLGIGPGSTIIKRTFFEEIGGYTNEYGAVGDMYFNLKAAAAGGIVLLPYEFVFYRRHEQQEFNNPFSYLYNTYRYLNDALYKLDLHLNKKEIRWLSKKNKRRFVTNLFADFRKNRNLKQTITAIKLAKFSFLDALAGIFH